MSLKLKKYIEFRGTLVCKTGLRIGGSKDDIEIGGLDNPIIRDPLSKLPYMPGSSLKGKLRSLLEYKEGKITPNGEPHGCKDEGCLICTVFGPHRVSDREFGPSRIIVRDAMLTDESEQELKEKLESGSLYTEIKQEVSINRRTGTASRAGPRQMERVPAGSAFNLNIALRIFEEDDEEKLVNFVTSGLELVQQDYIGGAGTRGYGWIEIRGLNKNEYEVD